LYLSPDQALSPEEKALLLRLTNLFERVVWVMQRYSDLLLKMSTRWITSPFDGFDGFDGSMDSMDSFEED